MMGFSNAFPCRTTAVAATPLVALTFIFVCFLWMPQVPAAFFRWQAHPWNGTTTTTPTEITPKDELDTALQSVSMGNKTVVIAVLNKAYVEQNAMLDLFLQSLRQGEGTEFLINHILFVAVDDKAFNRCRALDLHCYNLTTVGMDFSREVFYMTNEFNEMMWRRTLFLGDVLRRGYSFVFTDMDVMWLRNPFSKLHRDEQVDLDISCDMYYGRPFNNSNFNTGFYFATPNSRSIALFDEWYASRNSSKGMKDQDVLMKMKYDGVFERLGVKVRYLDTAYFSGFCHMSQDYKQVITVHSNCCVSMRAKLMDLHTVLQNWKLNMQLQINRSSNNAAWPPMKGICLHNTSASPALVLE